MRNSVSGFTILELLVGMIICSIVLTLIWNIYFILGDYQNLIETKSEKVLTLEKLKYLLMRDFEKAYAIETSSAQMTLLGLTDTIKYEFADEGILRSSLNFSEEIAMAGRFEIADNGAFTICLLQSLNNEVCLNLQLKQSSETKINSGL